MYNNNVGVLLFGGYDMKTLLVCDEVSINNHVGEEYDEILEVIQVPTTENIKFWADKIRDVINSLWKSDGNAKDQKVVVTLDSSAPYKAVLINLKIKMGEENNIFIDVVDSDGVVLE